jgi:hypothetical protein
MNQFSAALYKENRPSMCQLFTFKDIHLFAVNLGHTALVGTLERVPVQLLQQRSTGPKYHIIHGPALQTKLILLHFQRYIF